MDTMEPNRIADVYAEQTILITGGTGFMGKVLVEKLLRSCHQIKRIYLVVRTKKGKNPNERLVDVFSSPLFDLLKKTHGEDSVKKCRAISGDMGEPDMGLSAADRALLLQEVDMIFHCAATIRFDEQLKKAVNLNVRGTKLMLELAKECQHLKVFVHVSTSYCHLHERVLYEKPYPPPADPNLVMKCVEWLKDDIIESVTDQILGDIPNTYAFTKALGEALVVDEMDNLPIVLGRPSVVIPVWKEPLPGWTDNINGPTGLLIGAGKGVIRTMYCNQDGYADYLPVDIAVNGLIVMVWDYLAHGERRIFHMTSSNEVQVSWQKMIDVGRNVINTKMPLNGVVWYPGGSMKSNRVLHYLAVIFFHYLPAVVLDGLLVLLGYKPVLLRVQKRVSKGFEVFEYYANNQWDFNHDNAVVVRGLMNPVETKAFKIDGLDLDLEEYFTHCVHAARLYILKESDESIPTAKRHMRVMWWVDKICKTLILFGFAYLLFKHFIGPTLDVAW